MGKIIFALPFLAFAVVGAAVNGTVKDGKGNPVQGVLVVAEGTDQSAITDANGKFTMGPIQASLIPTLKPKIKTAHIRIDAQGRFQREKDGLSHQVYFSRPVSAGQSLSTTGARKAAAVNGDLLISHNDLFGEVKYIDVNDATPLNLVMEQVSEFAKTNQVSSETGDIKVLQFTDSLIQGVDAASKDNAVCRAGKVVYLPDTSAYQYKIVGKTMYMWDPANVDSGDYVTTLLTSATGSKLGTWNLSGLGQIPISLDAGVAQREVDSLLALQRSFMKVSGTETFSNTSIHNDVKFGVCMGPLMASAFTMEPLTAKSKSCSEIELKNGTAVATWDFVTNSDSIRYTFKYKDSTCEFKAPVSTGPAYDCNGVPDGGAPTDTSSDAADAGLAGFATCPAYISFFTGGITIPGGGFPGIGGLPLGKFSAGRFPNPISLERKYRARFTHRHFR